MSKSTLRRIALLLLDLVCVEVSLWLALGLRFGWDQAATHLVSNRSLTAMLLFLVFAMNVATRINRGFMKRGGAKELGKVIEYNAVLVVGIALLSALFRVNQNLSRLLVGYFAVIDVVAMCVARWLAKRAARAVFADQRYGSPIVMIVGPEMRDDVERRFRLGLTYQIAGWLTLQDGALAGSVDEQEVSCKVFELGNVLRGLGAERIPDFFVCAPEEDEHVIAQTVDAVERLGSNCHVAVEMPYASTQGASLGYFGEIPSLNYAPAGSEPYRHYVKRALDVVFSLTVLVLFCWLYLIVAIAVKVDDPSGPVFFKQRRVGKDGRPFVMWKFRSMYADAEQQLEGLQKLNEKDGPVFKIKDDPRITRVGHFIRKTSIDEMPQFLNVLKGDMSVVGPRPALPKEVAEYTPYQRERLLVKPGLTCYWQTQHNRDDISFDEWVDLDLLYVRQCSLRVDVGLVVRTVGVVLTAQGN